MHRRDPDERSFPRSRRSGTIQRGELRRAATPASSSDWAVIVVVAALALGAILVVGGVFGSPAGPVAATATPGEASAAAGSPMAGTSPSPVSNTSPTAPPTASPTRPATPSPTRPPTPTPTQRPTASPTRRPTPSPTARATATTAPFPSTRPTPSGVLVIVEPQDGEVVRERSIVVRGLAPPGAIVTRDIAFWFDEHTRADAAGRWSFAIELVEGENKLTFRIGDDVRTGETLNLRYEPD